MSWLLNLIYIDILFKEIQNRTPKELLILIVQLLTITIFCNLFFHLFNFFSYFVPYLKIFAYLFYFLTAVIGFFLIGLIFLIPILWLMEKVFTLFGKRAPYVKRQIADVSQADIDRAIQAQKNSVNTDEEKIDAIFGTKENS
jgi:hypothetical protein